MSTEDEANDDAYFVVAVDGQTFVHPRASLDRGHPRDKSRWGGWIGLGSACSCWIDNASLSLALGLASRWPYRSAK